MRASGTAVGVRQSRAANDETGLQDRSVAPVANVIGDRNPPEREDASGLDTHPDHELSRAGRAAARKDREPPQGSEIVPPWVWKRPAGGKHGLERTPHREAQHLESAAEPEEIDLVENGGRAAVIDQHHQAVRQRPPDLDGHGQNVAATVRTGERALAQTVRARPCPDHSRGRGADYDGGCCREGDPGAHLRYAPAKIRFAVDGWALLPHSR